MQEINLNALTLQHSNLHFKLRVYSPQYDIADFITAVEFILWHFVGFYCLTSQLSWIWFNCAQTKTLENEACIISGESILRVPLELYNSLLPPSQSLAKGLWIIQARHADCISLRTMTIKLSGNYRRQLLNCVLSGDCAEASVAAPDWHSVCQLVPSTEWSYRLHRVCRYASFAVGVWGGVGGLGSFLAVTAIGTNNGNVACIVTVLLGFLRWIRDSINRSPPPPSGLYRISAGIDAHNVAKHRLHLLHIY